MNYLLKFILAGGIITGANALMRWSPKVSVLLIALPISSLIYLAFLWNDTKDPALLSQASWDIFKIVIPSLVFFPVFSLALTKAHLSFPLAMLAGTFVSILFYLIQSKLGLA